MRGGRPRSQSRARCVIVNDSPTVPCSSEKQREAPARLVFGAQLPAAKNERRVSAKHGDLHVGKLQYAHLLARVVAAFVTLEDGLPATGDAIARDKNDVGRALIAVHVPFKIATVPGRYLCVEHGPDGGD